MILIGLLFTSICTTSIRAANEPTRRYLQYVSKQIAGIPTDTSYFTQNLLDSLIHQAVDLVGELGGYPTDTLLIVTVAGTIEYALDSNFANPLYVYSFKRDKALKQISPDELGLHKSNDTLDAEFYYIRGGRRTTADTLYRPTLGLQFVNRVDSIKVAFFRQPKRLTAATTVTDIPREFAVAIPHFMASWLMERNKQFDQALYHYQKGLAIINEVKARKQVTHDESFAPKVK